MYMYLLHSDDVNKMSLEMNLIFFRLIEASTKKGWKFSVLFLVDTSINRKKKLDLFLSLNFHFISTKKSVILTLINAGFFLIVGVLEIHMTLQYSFLVDVKSPQFFDQNKRYAITLIHIERLLNSWNKTQIQDRRA